MATHYSTVAVTVTFVLSVISVLLLKPQKNLFTMIKHVNVKDHGAVGDGKTDDSLAVTNAWNAICHNSSYSIGNFNFPTGNYQIGPLTFTGPCKPGKMVVNVTGNVTASLKNAWPNNVDTWIKFEHVTNLVITGPGSFNGNGGSWWNQCEAAKGTCENNPTALAFHDCRGLTLNGLTSINSPRNHISINACDGATITNINLKAPENASNTDGIDISATNGVNVNGGNIGTGDDCIAINGGSYNINITNLNCGPGHGISVGSLGRIPSVKEVVSNIKVSSVNFFNTQNGVRIKTVKDGSGSASNITFSGIGMNGVQNPIVLSQFYCPHQNCTHKSYSQAVQISGVTFYDIHGTSAGPNAIDIECANGNSCVGVALSKINIQPAKGQSGVISICKNANVQSNVVSPPLNCTPLAAASLIEMPLDYNHNDKSQQEAIATT
ncbi:hypothetical protein SSX86_016830 [Deinandra increscens subsp. villosa]|uniref:Polygalacturonase n=1 Tax=Deinandra increscens subsp. villosa TaxID=3103831 RepID=A0AAP0CYQ8_9ASTR